ncbi:MAG: hypothetical protein ACXAD7_17555 [Candidatus Kariarchaeaceae archaeon]|jgi:hypothetical protein
MGENTKKAIFLTLLYFIPMIFGFWLIGVAINKLSEFDDIMDEPDILLAYSIFFIGVSIGYTTIMNWLKRDK